jgi:hypothetical protein
LATVVIYMCKKFIRSTISVRGYETLLMVTDAA